MIEVELPAATDGDGESTTRRCRWTSRSAACSTADREVRRSDRRGGHRGARARACARARYLFNTLLADKATEDRLRGYPHWLAARNLANEASDESVQALIEAVRGRYEIPRRWYRLKARLLGLERLADYDRMASVTEDEVVVPLRARRARSCSTATRPSRPSSARSPSASSTSAGSTRPVRPAKRGGAFCAGHGPLGVPLRAAQLHLQAPRRADARPRARSRRALRARRPPGDLPPAHAADARRDRLGVRRDDRLREAARARTPRRPRGWRCSPRTSRTRSRRSSARSR